MSNLSFLLLIIVCFSYVIYADSTDSSQSQCIYQPIILPAPNYANLEPINTTTTFNNIDFMGLGYDVYTGFPLTTESGLDPGFKTTRIFDLHLSIERTADYRFFIPKGTSVVKELSCSLAFTSEEVSGEKQLQSHLALSASIQGDFPSGAFRASGEFQSMSTTASKNQELHLISKGECRVYRVWHNNDSPPPLSQSFLSSVKYYLVENHGGGYQGFLRTYGTHYPSSMILGARLTLIKSMKKESKKTLEQKNIKVSAAASFSAMAASGSAEFMYSKQLEDAEAFESAVTSTRISTIGSRPPTDGDANTWAQQSFLDPMPLTYTLSPISNLFTEKYFPDADKMGWDLKTMRTKLKGEIAQYCLQTINAGTNICLTPPDDDFPNIFEPVMGWTNLGIGPDLADSHGWGDFIFYISVQTIVVDNNISVIARGANGMYRYLYLTSNNWWQLGKASNVYADRDGFGHPEFVLSMKAISVGSKGYLFSRGAANIEVREINEQFNSVLAWAENIWTSASGWSSEGRYLTIKLESVGNCIYIFGRGPVGLETHRFNIGSSQIETNIAGREVDWPDLNWNNANCAKSIKSVVVGSNIYVIGQCEDYLELLQLDTTVSPLTWRMRSRSPPSFGAWKNSPYRGLSHIDGKLYITCQAIDATLELVVFDIYESLWALGPKNSFLKQASSVSVPYFHADGVFKGRLFVLGRKQYGLRFTFYDTLTTEWTNGNELDDGVISWDNYQTLQAHAIEDHIYVSMRSQLGLIMYKYQVDGIYASQSTSECVTLYRDTKYTPVSMILCESQSLPPDWNDQVILIKVPEGKAVFLYEDDSITSGQKEYFTTPGEFKLQVLGKKVSRVEIFSSKCPIFFTGLNLNGIPYSMCSSGDLPVNLHKDIRSIWKPLEKVMVIYSEPDYKGISIFRAVDGIWDVSLFVSSPFFYFSSVKIQDKKCPVFFEDQWSSDVLTGSEFSLCGSGNIDEPSKVGSVWFENGWAVVVLYKEKDYGGNYRVIRNQDEGLDLQDYKGQTKSVKIIYKQNI